MVTVFLSILFWTIFLALAWSLATVFGWAVIVMIRSGLESGRVMPTEQTITIMGTTAVILAFIVAALGTMLGILPVYGQ